MHKKTTLLFLAFIFCGSFLMMQPAAADTQDLTKTKLIIDHRWDQGNNIFDPTVWLYTESYVIDVNSGEQLNHKQIRYELYNPNGVLCEVQKHKTGRAWYNLQQEICAKADFEGPFKGRWTLKLFFDGDDKYAPCQNSLTISHENYDFLWGGSD